MNVVSQIITLLEFVHSYLPDKCAFILIRFIRNITIVVLCFLNWQIYEEYLNSKLVLNGNISIYVHSRVSQ